MDYFRRNKIKDLLKNSESVGIGNSVVVKGWVRTKRGNKNIAARRFKNKSNYLIYTPFKVRRGEGGYKFLGATPAPPLIRGGERDKENYYAD